MSRLLQVRRHSEARRADERGMGSALSPHGVSVARRLGDELGQFDLVLTSDIPRATETAIAMGFAIGEIDESLAPHDPAFWPEAEQIGSGRRLTFSVWAEIAAHQRAAWRHGQRQRERWLDVMSRVPEAGSALIVSHGGTIECGVVACFGADVWRDWKELAPCDGVQLEVERDSFVSAIVIRADVAGAANRA